MIERFKSGGVAVAQSGSTPTDQATPAQNGTATEKADGPEGSEKADDDGPGARVRPTGRGLADLPPPG